MTAALPGLAAGEPDGEQPPRHSADHQGGLAAIRGHGADPAGAAWTQRRWRAWMRRGAPGTTRPGIDYHADLPLVNTPVIRQVIGTSRLLIQLNRHQVSARRGVVISGASGTGKTTALTQLGRAHELAARKRHPQDRHRLPVVYITVPPAATPRMVAMEFARFFGLPAPARANLTDVTNAVCATAARTRVDLVLVDFTDRSYSCS